MISRLADFKGNPIGPVIYCGKCRQEKRRYLMTWDCPHVDKARSLKEAFSFLLGKEDRS